MKLTQIFCKVAAQSLKHWRTGIAGDLKKGVMLLVLGVILVVRWILGLLGVTHRAGIGSQPRTT